MWIYVQRSGNLYDPGGNFVETGYAGIGSSKNNPDNQCVIEKGPLPRGTYTIGAPIDGQQIKTGEDIRPDSVGPFALPLNPDAGNDMCDPKRTGFFIHGDSIDHPGEASNGCIIMSKATRQNIVNSGDTSLQVQADNPAAVTLKRLASIARRMASKTKSVGRAETKKKAKRLFENGLSGVATRDSSLGCGPERRAAAWRPLRRRRSGIRAT
jgi:hypothetical protein